MTAVLLSAVVQASILAVGANSYENGYKEAVESGKPLVVLVGADWCPACVNMKSSTLPSMARQGKLDRVAFSTVNFDEQPDLAREIMTGTSIPQIVVFSKTPLGWQRFQLQGLQSEERVDSLIHEAIEAQAPRVSSTSTIIRD